MTLSNPFQGRDDHLHRLPPEYYRGQARVHWSMTMEDRKTGWLIPLFYYKFREILTHTMFRYGLACPIFCCMPDHVHLLWMGLFDGSDQRNAVKYFRRQVNAILEKLATRFQSQPYDHVLRDEDCERSAFETVAEYVARNPERAKLVQPEGYRAYPYTDCLLAGYPELRLWQLDFWDRFWRIHAYQTKHGLMQMAQDESP
jgi:REP element-mobilizing transposase RayT